jgi:hypothetical protein
MAGKKRTIRDITDVECLMIASLIQKDKTAGFKSEIIERQVIHSTRNDIQVKVWFTNSLGDKLYLHSYINTKLDNYFTDIIQYRDMNFNLACKIFIYLKSKRIDISKEENF